jgi:hypothetical protein
LVRDRCQLSGEKYPDRMEHEDYAT